MAVVDQRADDARVVLQPLRSARRRCAAAPRSPTIAYAARQARTSSSSGESSRGRARRSGPGSPARPAGRRSTGSRRWTTPRGRPAATRPAPAPAATTAADQRRRAGPGSGARPATAPRAAAWPAGRRAAAPPTAHRARCRRQPRRCRGPWPPGAAARRAAAPAPPRRRPRQPSWLAAGAQELHRCRVDGLGQLGVGQMPLVRPESQRPRLDRVPQPVLGRWLAEVQRQPVAGAARLAMDDVDQLQARRGPCGGDGQQPIRVVAIDHHHEPAVWLQCAGGRGHGVSQRGRLRAVGAGGRRCRTAAPGAASRPPRGRSASRWPGTRSSAHRRWVHRPPRTGPCRHGPAAGTGR